MIILYDKMKLLNQFNLFSNNKKYYLNYKFKLNFVKINYFI